MRTTSLLLSVVLLGFCAIGCGVNTDGTLALPATSPETGTVTFSIKDAPLASMQTLTIDITGATLLGSGATNDYVVFPQATSPAFVQVDLLSLQGLGQVLAGSNVPVGTYGGLRLDYGNPQGTDNTNTPQNITAPVGFMAGTFKPTLVVTAGSLTGILIDVDLSLAWQDLGGNNALLTPVMSLQILASGTPPVPLQRFFGRVDSINLAQDKIDAQVVQWNSRTAPGFLGIVTVECDSATAFVGPTGISVGNTAAQLAVNDVVEINGVLSTAVIDANSVRLVGQFAGPMPPTAPPMNHVAGTLVNVNTTADTITVKAQFGYGPGAQTPYQDVVIDVSGTATIHRGATSLQLADLELGNYVHVLIDTQSQEATDIDEAPSFVCGDVTAVNLGGGASGANRVTMTPTSVNNIPPAQLPFLQASLMVDLPVSMPVPAMNTMFCVFAYFEGTALLSLSAPAGGGFTGPPPFGPPPVPAQRFVLQGQLETATTATVNAAGDIELSLTAFDINTAQVQNFDVTVDAAAQMTLFNSTGVTPLTTAAAAAAAINANPTALIQVHGTAAPVALAFTADLELNIIVGGGGTLPGPIPPPPPPVPGPNDFAFGIVQGTAVVNAAGDIEFDMKAPGPVAPTLAVTVSQTALLQKISNTGTVTLTVAQAVAELNTAPAPMVQVAGTLTGTDFDAHVSLSILRP